MKKSYINKSLVKEVLALTKEYATKEDVECIYFLPFTKEDQKFFEYHVVFDKYDEEKEKLFETLEKDYKTRIDEFGGKIIPTFNCSNQYSRVAMSGAECRRVKDLLSSQILYDPTGEYEEIAHQFDRYGTMKPYPNAFAVDLEEKKNTK